MTVAAEEQLRDAELADLPWMDADQRRGFFGRLASRAGIVPFGDGPGKRRGLDVVTLDQFRIESGGSR